MRAHRIAAALAIVLGLAGAATGTAAGTAAVPLPTFQTLLAESGVSFTPPAGFDDVDVPVIERFPFDRAMREKGGAMKVLYAVRPIARLEIEYNDPHNSAPNPNHIFPLIFESLTGVFSAGGRAPSRQFSASAARKRFNADWASATTFDVDPEIDPDYRLGFLIGAHKNNKADIYTLFLYNDPEMAKKRIDGLMKSLVFQAGE